MKDKFSYFLFAFTAICATTSHAQVCPDTVTQISTNFDGPINTQFQTTFPGQNNPFLNRYDWAGYRPLIGFDDIDLNPMQVGIQA